MTTRTFTKGLRPGLYAITDSLLLPASTIAEAVAAALRGGAVLVQYRDKTSTDTERLRIAQNLQTVCGEGGVPLLINDDPVLALRVRAAGVHLGQQDGSLSDARNRLGEDAIIGATCHGSIELAQQARAAGVDYLAFGRFFESQTKPGAGPASLSVLTEAASLGLPITAIGGIAAIHSEALINAGADMLAVVGGLFGADDIEQQARVFTQLFARHHPFFSDTDSGVYYHVSI